MKSILTPALVVLLSVASASTVFAQAVQIGPNGIRVVPDDRGGPPPPPPPRGGSDRYDFDRDTRTDEISDRQAIRIARGEGLREVDAIRRGRRTIRVIGADRRGDDIEVDIDRRNGDVVQVR